MEIDQLTLRLLFLSIPGLFAYGTVAALAPKKQRSNTIILLQVFIYGAVSYALLYLLAGFFSSETLSKIGLPATPTIFTPDLTGDSSIQSGEIIYGAIVSLILGLLVTVNLNRSIAVRILRWLQISSRYSDVDVWNFVFNSRDIEPWVTIRDKKHDLVYDGYVEAYSPDTQLRELLLSRVKVFDNIDGSLKYETPVLYLSFEHTGIEIEFRG